MAFDLKKRVAAAAAGKDMTQASGGGDYTPPEEGRPNLRFIGYYELGQHEEKTGQYKGKVNTKVRMVFELSGPKWEPRDTESGKVPQTMFFDMNYSLNEKAGFFKLFNRMNDAHGKQFKTMAEMLGLEFKGQIKHVKKTPAGGGKERTYANLLHDTIGKAERENEAGDMVAIVVPPQLTPLKGFLWDHADPEMWDDIFIEGEYPERKDDKTGEVLRAAQSKNVIQAFIMSALNFKGCPIYDYAMGKVSKGDLAAMEAALADEEQTADESEATQTQPNRADALDGVA